MNAFGLFLTSHKKIMVLCKVETQSRNERNEKVDIMAVRV